MRIGMFTDAWLPTHDGTVTSIIKFRESLEQLGHDVFIFAPGDRTGVSPDDDRVFLFKGRVFKQYPDYKLAIAPSKWKTDMILEHDIDILHNHGIAFMALKAMFASNLTDIPCILNFHTWVTEVQEYYPVNIDEDLMVYLSWIYLKVLIGRSDGVITPSNAAMKELKEKAPNMRYSSVVAPGIDAKRFNPSVNGSGIREDLGFTDSEVLVHVGRVSREKNLELIFKALPQVRKERPDVKLLVVGSGPAKEYYEGMARDLKLDDIVKFTGFVSDETLPQYYAAGDAFVLASPFETLGIVMIEALAMGLPVAGLDHRVVPDIINDGVNGHLFKNDPGNCASQMIKTLKNRESLKPDTVAIANKFNNLESGKKLVKVYTDVIDIYNKTRSR
ncbi:MAG: glycosyltransferase [Thermoplasmata archaeon]|nr:glycosyltransferase [Thermoplasmata archaeon]